MPNYCENQIHFDCTPEVFKRKILPLLRGKDHNGEHKDLTFNVLVPMPDNIFRGVLGEKEKAQYGKDNWYDWSCTYWGTKWDAFDVRIEPKCVSFTTAWTPPEAWLRALARKLYRRHISAYADFYAEGGFPGSLGGFYLHNGLLQRTDASKEFAEIYACKEEEE